METLKQPLSLPSTKLNSIVVGLLALFGVLGFLDASYLTIEHYRQVVPPCSIVSGCTSVLTSEYATIGPVPVALLGVLYYLTLIVLTLLFIDTKKESIKKIIRLFTWAGVIATTYFIFLMAAVIHNWCLYCLGSAISSTALFIIARFKFFSS